MQVIASLAFLDEDGVLDADHPLTTTLGAGGMSEDAETFDPEGKTPQTMKVRVYLKPEPDVMELPVYDFDGTQGWILAPDVEKGTG